MLLAAPYFYGQEFGSVSHWPEPSQPPTESRNSEPDLSLRAFRVLLFMIGSLCWSMATLFPWVEDCTQCNGRDIWRGGTHKLRSGSRFQPRMGTVIFWVHVCLNSFIEHTANSPGQHLVPGIGLQTACKDLNPSRILPQHSCLVGLNTTNVFHTCSMAYHCKIYV